MGLVSNPFSLKSQLLKQKKYFLKIGIFKEQLELVTIPM